MDIIKTVAEELEVSESRVEAAVKLLDEGNTVPFIARYRKEATGSLDDIQLRKLSERLSYLRAFVSRRDDIYAAIEKQGKMTPEIAAALDGATILAELEDIYRPYVQGRKTRASAARENGLEPLAELIFEQRDAYSPSIEEEAEKYISEKVESAEKAVAGACDIIAENISDDADCRKTVRALTRDFGTVEVKAAKNEDSVYSMYYDYSEKLSSLPAHRILAINRGEKEEFLKASVVISKDIVLNQLFASTVTNYKSPAFRYVASAIIDSYDRLIAPSIAREIRSEMFDDAAEGAIKLFSQNLKSLLMQPPLRGKTVMGYDPGYRTGCKLAVVDRTGKVLDTAVIYPTKPYERIEAAKKITAALIKKYGVEVISIGNGTASKESEIFISELLRETGVNTKYVITSEAGASVYSASELGTEEFPDFDVTERSAVSIARRLQDPLAELVKIDPKAIGVGQYQHDMKQSRLDEALSGVVEDCVNAVGVDVNTASWSLLGRVSGLSNSVAKNIVKYREENGEFSSRRDILKTPKLGAKTFEQAAGFLRVPRSEEIFDNTGVHPESYKAAAELLSLLGFSKDDVRAGRLSDIRARANARRGELLSELGVGEPTLDDIIAELERPGRDIRDDLPAPALNSSIMDISDLKPGMKLRGVVRNVIDFGAFVDIGVHDDGLLHISEMSDKFVKHPSELLKVGDVIEVTVKDVDLKKKRVALTRRTGPRK